MSEDNGWRPIETAPTDGTPLLLYLKNRHDERKWIVSGICDFYAIGFWQHARWCSIEVVDEGSMGGEMTGWMEDWCSVPIEPTHWMPLPDPP